MAYVPSETHSDYSRHTFATDMRRVAGTRLRARRSDTANSTTTLAIYGHQDVSDLERAMDKYEAAKDEPTGAPTWMGPSLTVPGGRAHPRESIR
jgi:hypothetical protein